MCAILRRKPRPPIVIAATLTALLCGAFALEVGLAAPARHAPQHLEVLTSGWWYQQDIAAMDGLFALRDQPDGVEVVAVDAAGPPRRVAKIDLGFKGHEGLVKQVLVDGERGYVHTVVYGGPDPVQRNLIALDLQDPRRPRIVGQLRNPIPQGRPGSIGRIATTNRVLWFCATEPDGESSLFAISMRDPVRPRRLARLPGYRGGVAIRGDVLFTQGRDGRVVALDIERPERVQPIATLPLRAQELALDGPHLVAVVTHDSREVYPPQLLEVWDIDPPQQAHILGRLTGLRGSYGGQLAVDHDVAYVVQPDTGSGSSLVAVDLRTPERPTVAARTRLGRLWLPTKPRIVDDTIHVHGYGDEGGHVAMVGAR